MRFATRQIFTALLLAVTFALPSVFAQDAASLVPGNAAVFIEVNDLATLRKDWASDPLAKFLQSNLPMTPEPEGWVQVQKVLGLSGDEVVDRFFGKTVALVIFNPGDNDPGMVLTKISDADMTLAIEKLQLKPVKDFAGYRGFKTADDKSHIALGNGWAIVTQPQYSAAAQAVLEAKEKPLADSELFKSWLGKLPAGDRAATFYVRQNDDNVHALGVYRKERDLTIQYRGKAPELAALFANLGTGGSLDFGPLPASTIAAITSNIVIPPGPNSKQLDRMFPGKSFEKDIHSKIASPAVVFLGEVTGDKLAPNPGLSLPVVGVSLKLRDPKVADDLTKAIDGLMFVANFAASKWQAPLIEVKAQQHGEITYQNANVGIALAHRTERAEIQALTLTYGRVGDWYVICTQDQFYKQCIDSHLDSTQSLIASRPFTSMGLKNHGEPIATAVLKPSALAAHMETWVAHWKKVRPQVVEASDALEPTTPEAQLVRGARIISGLLDHYQSMSLQAYRDGEGIAAQADVVRK